VLGPCLSLPLYGSALGSAANFRLGFETVPVAHIAWLGKKSPFCGNVTYGLSTTEALKKRGHQTSFIHFDNPGSPGSSNTSLLAHDPDVSLPYLVKSQVYTIPSPRAQRELRESLNGCSPMSCTPASPSPPSTFGFRSFANPRDSAGRHLSSPL
jgi:hypothetical protein